jgi:AraC family transcriptional regulator of adaptative response/methylated-DNA-[protein]-cysteine methyltransferase
MQSLLHRAYHPLLFDRHEIIHANDLWVESLYYSALRQPCDQAKFVPQPPKILHTKTAALCLPAWPGRSCAVNPTGLQTSRPSDKTAKSGSQDAPLLSMFTRKEALPMPRDPITPELPDEAYHFNVVRRALQIIDATPAPGPSLNELAGALRMSSAHLQRVFSRWAGVSPKRYQQFLMLDHAKHLLADHFTVLETADAAGLSGSGRLHDLFLRWEAMSPGEYAKGAAGLTIRYGWFDSPFGDVLAMATDRGLCGMAFGAETGRDAAFADMIARWPNADFIADPAPLAHWVAAAFSATGTAQLHLLGGPFQIKVWEALLAIPSGQVTTYSEIARHIGTPNAARAVGTAVGRNPISWLIPCHRALRKSGGLGGYHWGLPVKRAMLAYETAEAETRQTA